MDSLSMIASARTRLLSPQLVVTIGFILCVLRASVVNPVQ